MNVTNNVKRVSSTANDFSASAMLDIAIETGQRREFAKIQRRIKAHARNGKNFMVTTRYVDAASLASKGFVVDQTDIPCDQPNVFKVRTTIKW